MKTRSTQRALPDVPARALRGQLRHQSVDGPAELGARRARARAATARMGGAASQAAGARRNDRARPAACRACPISSSPPMPPSCSTGRCCWRASAIPSASARSRISRRRSARCRRAAWSMPCASCRTTWCSKAPATASGTRPASCSGWAMARVRTPPRGARSRTCSDRRSIALELADQRFYHMDTALARCPAARSCICRRPSRRPAGR